jgi:hypothetical protein
MESQGWFTRLFGDTRRLIRKRRLRMTRRTLLFILIIGLSTPLWGCATQRYTPTATDENGPIFTVPKRWEIVNQRQVDRLYQADLRDNAGAGRLLVGRLELSDSVRNAENGVLQLHTALIDRIRNEADLTPFAREQLTWSNGIVGYRTKLRGELGGKTVVLEGITLSDDANAYLHFGLFPETTYETSRTAYEDVLRSLSPLRGATVAAQPITEEPSQTAPETTPDVSEIAGRVSTGLEIGGD